MGAKPSREEVALRGILAAPLAGVDARLAGVIGTLSLDVEVEDSCWCTCKSSPIWCCCGRGEFRVPWPCHCCGADCCCCPHAPRGDAWEAALAGGFRALLKEAGAAVHASAGQRFSAMDLEGRPVGVTQNVLLANARATLLQAWSARALPLLAPFGLSVSAFNWVEDRRDDKGNKTGEVLRCALQFYSVPQLPAQEAPEQGFYPPPPTEQQQYYQQGAAGAASGAPKQL
jgi:hypothetical protein